MPRFGNGDRLELDFCVDDRGRINCECGKPVQKIEHRDDFQFLKVFIGLQNAYRTMACTPQGDLMVV